MNVRHFKGVNNVSKTALVILFVLLGLFLGVFTCLLELEILGCCETQRENADVPGAVCLPSYISACLHPIHPSTKCATNALKLRFVILKGL